MTTRSDIHRPAQFDPVDYRVIDYIDARKPEPPHPASGAYGNADAMAAYDAQVAAWQARVFEHFPDWQTDGGDHRSIRTCNHCGHPGIRWVAVVEHTPTGGRLAFGEICAERCDLPGRDAFRVKFIKDRAAREAAGLAALLKDAEFDAANPGLRDYLADHQDDDFLGSLYGQLRSKHELSDKQVEAIARRRQRDAEFEQRKQDESDQLADAPTLADGRYAIEGEVVSVKWKDSHYGGAWKMLVRLDDGNKVWGTAPETLVAAWIEKQAADEQRMRDDVRDQIAAMSSDQIQSALASGDTPRTNGLTWTDAARGTRVSFAAQVTRSHDDDHFGFFKRPTSARMVEGVAS